MKREFVAVMSRDVLNFIALSNPLEEYQLVKFLCALFFFFVLCNELHFIIEAIGLEWSDALFCFLATSDKKTLKILS